METQKKSRVLKWSLIIGITIVLNLFFGYSLSVVYQSPQFEDFCKNEQVVTEIQTKEACLQVGGQWNENTYPQKVVSADGSQSNVVNTSYCDRNYTCQKNFQDANNNYDRNVFVTLVILGVVTLGLSFVFASNEVIAQGLALGGVLSFFIASLRYWGSANDLVKVFILAVALVALFYLAYKKFNTVNQG